MEEIFVVFADDDGEEIDWPVMVSPAGPNLYRVEQHPDFAAGFVDYDDIFEVQLFPAGLRFVKVVKKSTFKCFDFTIGPGTVRSKPMQRVLSKVDGLGGRWDFLINFLYVYVPGDVDYDPTPEIELVRSNRTRRALERDMNPSGE